MSFYSDQNVSTRYTDPKIYTENSRCTFELDSNEAAYLPNMRLLFVGLISNNATDYNQLLGATGLIRNARLLDGKTVLCAANENQFYQGFRHVNSSNERNQSVDSFQSCSALGFSVDGLTRTVDRVTKKLGADINPVNAINGNRTNSATIDLRTIFPMLNSVSHLPTAVFRNLRVEIEFDANQASQIIMDTNNTIKTIRPVLATDVLLNPALVDSMNSKLTNASWLEIEHDLFVIPSAPATAANSGVRQNVNVKINGFNNKHLERLVMVKEIQNAAKELNGTAVQGLGGRFSSQCCFRQETQFRVNGGNLLPRQGITGNNERLAYIVDTFGECSSYIGSNQYGGDNSAELTNARALLGQLDYIGVYIGQPISDLQINYSRVGLEDATLKSPTTDALNAHCYGEIRKQLIVGNGSYTIQYA
tara:strand:- start:103 stop:1362 length:1260 start_codon:yes stop_codon:yes gene_type:complete